MQKRATGREIAESFVETVTGDLRDAVSRDDHADPHERAAANVAIDVGTFLGRLAVNAVADMYEEG